jgi:NADH-quinone oxidoreductase subunit N
MNAPMLWIILPLVLSGLLIIPGEQKYSKLVICLFTFFLVLAAWILPIDSALTLGGWTFKLAPSLDILGRSLILTSADRAFLALIYGSALFWFIPASFLKGTGRLIPLGLAITALLVAALAVTPFLYAALLIELAVLLSIPLLSSHGKKPGKGLIRFIIFQTLAVPFILFSGWLLAGIEANPGDLSLVKQAAILLGLGFALLLAIFPFYTWIPQLAEDAPLYNVGFIFWILPTATLFFGLGFIDRYTWLRDAPTLEAILTTVGTLMVVTGGFLAAFQRQLGRILGYAVVVETGFSLLAFSMTSRLGLNAFYMLLVPRTLGLGVWSFALAILKEQAPGLTLSEVKGLGRVWPYTVSGLILASLGLAGMPLLAGFPAHQTIWEGLALSSLPLAFWVFLGSLGLFVSAIRMLFAFFTAPEGTYWKISETRSQKILLVIGILALILLGLFPQWILPLWTKLPTLFEHLG